MTSMALQQNVVKQRRRPRLNQGYLFVAPAFLLFSLMTLYPAAYVFWLSLRGSGAGLPVARFVGLENFSALLGNTTFWTTVRQTVFFAGASTVLHLMLGLGLALYLNARLNPVVLRLCRALLLLPWALTPVAVAVAARLLYHPQISLVAIVARDLGFTGTWAPLADPSTALTALTAVNAWHYTPFYMLMVLTSLQSLPQTLYEAASIDGANSLQNFRFITLPYLRRVLVTLGLFDFVTTAVYFDLVWTATQGGPMQSTQVLPTFIYRLAFQQFKFGPAAAAGIILVLTILVLSAIVLIITEREREG